MLVMLLAGLFPAAHLDAQQTSLRLRSPRSGDPDSTPDTDWRPQRSRGVELRLGASASGSPTGRSNSVGERPPETSWRPARPESALNRPPIRWQETTVTASNREPDSANEVAVAPASFAYGSTPADSNGPESTGAGRWARPSRIAGSSGAPLAGQIGWSQQTASPDASRGRAQPTPPMTPPTSVAPLTSAEPSMADIPLDSPAATPRAPMGAGALRLAQVPSQPPGGGQLDDAAPPPPTNLGQDPEELPGPGQDPAPAPQSDRLEDLIDRARERQRQDRDERRRSQRRAAPNPRYNNQICGADDSVMEMLHGRRLSDIRLDTTPPFRPRATEEDRREKLAKNLAAAESRTWQDASGAIVAEGKLADYKWGRVYVDQIDGQRVAIPFDNLGLDEQCFVTGWWEVPAMQRLAGQPYQYRHFTPTTFTWQASAACYNPLYFEQPRLERYGHTIGILQPVASGAHFFTSIATLPYHMGIHPPNECRYPLGFYRVGECAPRLLPPVPISLRGALLQAGLFTGGVFALP